MSSSKRKTPCDPCRNLGRKCDNNCMFEHHFPPHHLNEFESLKRVYGVSNVEKLLKNLPIKKRDSAIKSLIFEADARIKDPVYGCLGYVSILEKLLKQVQTNLLMAKKELATYTRQNPNQQPVNIPFDGAPREPDLLSKMKTVAGPSGQTTQPRHLSDPGVMSTILSLGGSYDDNMGQILQQELYHHMQQLVTDQLMTQQEDQSTQSQKNQEDGSEEGMSFDPSG